jgi:hypothetical protein
VQFQAKAQQPSASEPANAPSVGMSFIASFLQRSLFTLEFTFHLIFAEEILVDHPVEISSPQHTSSPRAEPSCAQVETLSSSGTQSSPSQAEVPASSEMNPLIEPEASSPLRVQSPLGQAEIPVLTEINPSSPQPEASNLPGTAPVSLQVEASALPRAPQALFLLAIQESLPEPEQALPSAQGIRHEVSACSQFCYLLLINHSQLGNPFFSGSNFITIKLIHGE